jgi:DNA-binding NarL/FixJ family response regulator
MCCATCVIVVVLLSIGHCGMTTAFFLDSSSSTVVNRRRRRRQHLASLAIRHSSGNHHDNHTIEEFGTTSSSSSQQQRDAKFQERSNRWVVLVDDEESIRKAVGQYLFDQGYAVTACADAPTALNVICQQESKTSSAVDKSPPPDAIISDIRMPNMDGLTMLREIRANPLLVGVPVILLTAKSQTQERIAGYKAGADAYVPKPFDPEELLSIVDNVILRHETLNGGNIEIDDLRRDLDEIKYLLLEKGGAGIGNGWVEATNVFLTPDERQVLELLCEGLMTKEIASRTFLSTRRVEQLITSMFRKTETSNRTELVRWAVATGNVQI